MHRAAAFPPSLVADVRVRTALATIQANYSSHLTSGGTAAALGLSRSRLEHLFKQETGATFRRKLQDVRLAVAQGLLADPTLRVKEIAARCGYAKTCDFTRAYHARFGVAPSEWRRSTFGKQIAHSANEIGLTPPRRALNSASIRKAIKPKARRCWNELLGEDGNGSQRRDHHRGGLALRRFIQSLHSPKTCGEPRGPRGRSESGHEPQSRTPGVDWRKNGRTLVLAISTQSHFCTDSAPFFRALVAQAAKNVKIVAVLPQPVDAGEKYLSGEGVRIDQVLQASLPSIGVTGTPTTLLANSGGVVTNVWVGELQPAQQQQALAVLTGAPVASSPAAHARVLD